MKFIPFSPNSAVSLDTRTILNSPSSKDTKTAFILVKKFPNMAITWVLFGIIEGPFTMENLWVEKRMAMVSKLIWTTDATSFGEELSLMGKKLVIFS